MISAVVIAAAVVCVLVVVVAVVWVIVKAIIQSRLIELPVCSVMCDAVMVAKDKPIPLNISKLNAFYPI